MVTLRYHDDKKEKPQSHEVQSSHTTCDADCYGYFDITGYGADRSEALTHFINGAKALQDKLQQVIDMAAREQEQVQ